MNLEAIMLRNTVTRGHTLCDCTCMGQLRDKGGWWLQRLEGGEGAELLIGVEFQSCKAKKVLEMDGGDNSTI